MSQTKNPTITLSREQAQDLSTVIATMVGALQYKATQTPDGSLDASFNYWSEISQRISSSFGFAGWRVPSVLTKNLMVAN
jgi:hypothetical protein